MCEGTGLGRVGDVVLLLSKVESRSFDWMMERLGWLLGSDNVLSYSHGDRGDTCLLCVPGWGVTALGLCGMERMLRGFGWVEDTGKRVGGESFYRCFRGPVKGGHRLIVEYDVFLPAFGCRDLLGGSIAEFTWDRPVVCMVFTAALCGGGVPIN